MRAIWTLARRELRALFDHPTGYILLVVFLTLNNFLYFRQVFLVGAASLRPMLELLPWLMLFFVPAVTMRALAEDVRSGTVEVVLAQPISEWQFLLGKFLGQLLFVWTALAVTLLVPVGLSLGADLQVGVIVAQYVGSALLAAGFTAVGVWASSLSRNQITAFIVGVATMFALLLIGLNPVLMGLPPAIAAVVANLGVLAHFANIARGVIDLRDVVYFLSVAAAFLVLAYWSLMGAKLSPRRATRQRLRLGAALLVATVVVINLFGRHITGRLDLTPGKAYTLSPATKDLLGELPDLVTLRLFVSAELPPEVSLLKRDVDDLLADLREAGGGKIRVVDLDPADDPDAAAQAKDLGIPPVQFNVARRAEFQVKEGYLGLAIQFADQSQTIPLIQRTDDLEYRLASAIRTLTRPTEPKVGFQATAPMMARGGQSPRYSTLRRRLAEGYTVEDVDIAADSLDPATLPVLVVAGSPPALTDTVRTKVTDYLRAGGAILVMAGGMEVSALQDQPIASGRSVGWNTALEPYGVTIESDMVYDLGSNEAVSMRTAYGNVLMNYPFWLRALSTKASTINQEIASLFLPWTSQVDVSKAAPGIVVPLYTTSRAGGVEEGAAMISPERREYNQTNLAPRVVAAMINPLASSDSVPVGLPRGRVIVVGNSDFVNDQWVSNAPQNIAFVQNAVDWLSQDEALIGIRAKDRSPPSLLFEQDSVRDLVHYGNVAGVPFLLMLLGAFRLWRRRRRTRRTYQPLPRAEVT